MTVISSSDSRSRHKLLLPILVGGFAAGLLDLIAAFITMGWGIPRGIAGGLIGAQARHGGVAIWVLGVLIHFFIAFSAAAIYCASSIKLDFLRDHPLVCGLFYGIAIFLFMNLVVLPLSALHATGPYEYSELIQGLIISMFIIGIPISVSLWKLSN